MFQAIAKGIVPSKLAKQPDPLEQQSEDTEDEEDTYQSDSENEFQGNTSPKPARQKTIRDNAIRRNSNLILK